MRGTVLSRCMTAEEIEWIVCLVTAKRLIKVQRFTEPPAAPWAMGIKPKMEKITEEENKYLKRGLKEGWNGSILNGRRGKRREWNMLWVLGWLEKEGEVWIWSRYDKRSGREERREKVKGEREEKEKKGQKRKQELTSPGRQSQDLS